MFLLPASVPDSERSVCQTADADQRFIRGQGRRHPGALQHPTQVALNYSSLPEMTMVVFFILPLTAKFILFF